MNPLFQLLNNTADGAFVIDSSQRIIYWNSAAERILGFSADEVLGHSCHEIIRGRDDDDRVWCRGNCPVTRTIHAGQTIESFDTCARAKTGDLRWINISILSTPDSDNETEPLIVHLFRDAAQQKQHERFARQVQLIVQDLQQMNSPQTGPLGAQRPTISLTERETEVLILLAHGQSTTQIARALSISQATTRNHIQNIFQKLDVHSRAAAVAWAFEQGLVAAD